MRVADHMQPFVAFTTFLDMFLSHFIQHQQLDSFKVRYKCGAAWTLPAGAAPVLTFALNTHMWVGGSGMWATLANWGNIWGFMYCLPGTAVWSTSPCSVWRLAGRGRGLRGWRASPQTAQLSACQTDKQWQTADTFLRKQRPVTEAGGCSPSSFPQGVFFSCWFQLQRSIFHWW